MAQKNGGLGKGTGLSAGEQSKVADHSSDSTNS